MGSNYNEHNFLIGIWQGQSLELWPSLLRKKFAIIAITSGQKTII